MKNYTPLNVKKEKTGGGSKANLILIIVAVLTAGILTFIGYLLFTQQANKPSEEKMEEGPVQEEVQDNISPPPVEDLGLEEEASSSSGLEGETPTPTEEQLEELLSTTPSPSVSPTP